MNWFLSFTVSVLVDYLAGVTASFGTIAFLAMEVAIAARYAFADDATVHNPGSA
jgi:hypothetical protein